MPESASGRLSDDVLSALVERSDRKGLARLALHVLAIAGAGAAYAAALEAVTGEPVARMVFVFLDRAGAIEAELPDLRAAVDEAKAAEAAGLSG